MSKAEVAKRRREESALAKAAAILAERAKAADGHQMSTPNACRDYFRVAIGGLGHEEFVVAYLSSQNKLLAFESLFRGTLNMTSVYPREVVKSALRHNAGAVIFAHNHPSGVQEPSRADELLTQTLKQALALIDVRVLDHFVITCGGSVSFAERGLL